MAVRIPQPPQAPYVHAGSRNVSIQEASNAAALILSLQSIPGAAVSDAWATVLRAGLSDAKLVKRAQERKPNDEVLYTVEQTAPGTAKLDFYF